MPGLTTTAGAAVLSVDWGADAGAGGGAVGGVFPLSGPGPIGEQDQRMERIEESTTSLDC